MAERKLPYLPFHPTRTDLPGALEPEEFQRAFPEESQHVEFKKGIGKDQMQETVVAFSNADGGVILVGVADDGEIVGRNLDAGTMDAIHQLMRDVRNPGRYSLRSISVGDRTIVALFVARRREGFAQVSNGVVRVRKGTRDEPLFGADLQHFINERAPTRFELTPIPAVPIESADAALLERLGAAYGWGADDLPQRLAENGFAEEGNLTVAGVLYLANNPSDALGKAHVEILRYRQDDSVDYDLRLAFHGPLPVQLQGAAQRVLDELGTELVVLGVRRYDLPIIPPVVIREAIANALAHRSYELNRTPVRIEIRPSSVSILSPGGLPEPVTVENMRETTAPRNLALIAALRRFGLAEDAGRGIDVMEDAMREEMLEPPRFSDGGHEVAVTLPVRSAVAPVERAWIRELEQRGTLQGSDRLALVHAARGEALTNARVREIMQVDEGTARLVLQRLRDAGFLEQRGERGGATYRLEGSLEPPAGLRLGRDELASLIENLAAEGPIGNADIREATGLTRDEVRALLRGLVKEGRLIQTGQKRGTRYRVPSS